jgi:hypothetical protein
MHNIHINGRNICNKLRQFLDDIQWSNILNIDKTAFVFNVRSCLNDIKPNKVSVIFTYFLTYSPDICVDVSE